MDVIQLYKDFGIKYLTEGHKHCRPGYVNTPCPFCTGNAGYHLSYNLDEDYFVCWRCGWKPTVKTLSALLRVEDRDIYPLLKIYEASLKHTEKKKIEKIKFRFPSDVHDLFPHHAKYLRKRKFDPEKIEREWGIKSLGPTAKLKLPDGKVIDYSHRILLPFRWNGVEVSFDSRDVTGKTEKRYNACPIEMEAIEHKRILYANQEKWASTGVGVEGPTDAWRLGPKSFGTSGSKFTPEQVKVITRSFKRVFLVRDPDMAGFTSSRKLKREIELRGVECKIITIPTDPGDLPQDDADHLMRELIPEKQYFIMGLKSED